MSLSMCCYSQGALIFQDEFVSVYEAIHKVLGKSASLWVIQMPAESFNEAAFQYNLQLGLEASISHPNLPSIYSGGIDSNLFYYIQEDLEKNNLIDHIASTPINTKEDFYRLVRPLISLCLAMSRQAVSWQNLRLEDIVVKNVDNYRVQRWNPLCRMDHVSLPDGLGPRLTNQPGVYCAEENFDFDKNTRRLADWLYHIVGPKTRPLEDAIKDFRILLAQKRKKDESEPRFIPEADIYIERYIYRLAHSKSNGGFKSMTDILDGLNRLRRGETMEPIPGGGIDSGGGHASSPFSSESMGVISDVSLPYIGTSGSVQEQPKAKEKKRFLPILLVVFAIVIVISAAFLFLNMQKGNKPPSANIMLLQTKAKVHEKVIFDASRSSDPENAPLHFYWRIVEPLDIGNDFYITRNRTPSAVSTTMQFFRPGKYKIQLIVDDGDNQSDPKYVTIEVVD